VAPTAVLSGDVRVGPGSCVLHGAVLNADGGAVRIGANCVIMENAVLRGTHQADSPPARKDDAMRIAVTGASGRIGGEVVRLLVAQKHQVVALTRRPPGTAPGPAGAEVRQAGYADEPTLAAALDGMATLVLVSSDGPVADVIVHHRNLIRAAARRGVAHIVALNRSM
jgi:hypothetical protein